MESRVKNLQCDNGLAQHITNNIFQHLKGAAKKAVLLGTAALMPLAVAQTAIAQNVQRQIINPSFEDVTVPASQFNPSAISLTDGATWDDGIGNQQTADENIIGWKADFVDGSGSAFHEVELWGNGFLGITSQDGLAHVELSPSEPTTLYQEVCLLNGEDLSWALYHKGRPQNTINGGVYTQVIEYRVRSLDGTSTIQVLDTNTIDAVNNNIDNPTSVVLNGNTVNISGVGNINNRRSIAGNVLNDWELVSGTTIYTGPSGNYRLEFASTAPAGSAAINHIDNVQIELVPLISFSPSNTSDFETGSGPYPSIVISGNLLEPATVTFSTTGTATLGVDYILSSNTITIPAGSYDGVSAGSLFEVPIVVNDDGIYDTNETVIFSIDSISTSSPQNTPVQITEISACSNSVLPQSTHTILDVAEPSMTLTKVADDATDRKLGETITYTYTVENTGNVNIDNVTIGDQHTSASGTSTLPVAGEIGDAGNSPASTDATADNGSWDVLAPGDIVTFTSTYLVTAGDAGGNITNSATANGLPVGGTLTPPTANETVTVEPLVPRAYAQPNEVCGATNAEAFFIDGPGFSEAQIVQDFQTRFTDFYAPQFERHADGSVIVYSDALAQATLTGDINTIGISNLNSTPRTGALSTEVWHIETYLEGEPGSTVSFNVEHGGNGNPQEFFTYWTESTSGAILDAYSDGGVSPNWFGGWDIARGGDGEFGNVSFTFPSDGAVYLSIVMVDPQAVFGPMGITYECPAPELSFTKLADNDTDRKPGDTITYTYTVVNTGNVNIDDVTIDDQHTAASGTSTLPVSGETGDADNSTDSTDATTNDGTWDVLAPGDRVTFSSTYLVTEADVIDGGDLTNTATVTVTPAAGSLPSDPVTADEAVSVAPLDVDLSLTKTNTPGVNGEVDQASDTLTFGDNTTYTLVVTNNGPDVISGALVTDTVGAGLTCATTDTVTISGDGVPAGSFTIGDLTGAGITLETLADGDAATLNYTCEVN